MMFTREEKCFPSSNTLSCKSGRTERFELGERNGKTLYSGSFDMHRLLTCYILADLRCSHLHPREREREKDSPGVNIYKGVLSTHSALPLAPNISLFSSRFITHLSSLCKPQYSSPVLVSHLHACVYMSRCCVVVVVG